MCVVVLVCFKQKTSYERRISDWSSDVCASDLRPVARSKGSTFHAQLFLAVAAPFQRIRPNHPTALDKFPAATQRRGPPKSFHGGLQIGRAPCRERVCQYV